MSDPLAAYQVDAAVVMLGTVIDNALQEEVNAGSEKKPHMVRLYTLPQLLDPSFKLPRPLPPPKPVTGIAALKALVGNSGGGVRAYRYVGPPN